MTPEERAAALDDYELQKAKIEAEIRAARDQGQAWTELRPFLDWRERMGAGVCRAMGAGVKHGRRGRAAEYVSYCTQLPGRIVLCESCYQACPYRPGGDL